MSMAMAPGRVTTAGDDAPAMTFFQVIDAGLAPQRADASALGTVPTDGFRYCEPLRAASAFGWYVFLPTDLKVRWDGFEFFWSIDDGRDWYDLTSAVQYPDAAARFDAAAPEGLRGLSPPFLKRTNAADTLQIWSGCFVQTQAGMSTLVRAPSNLPAPMGCRIVEGIVETDWWFGPLFANVQFTHPDQTVTFRADWPFVQLQPVPQSVLREAGRAKVDVARGIDGFGAAQWDRYRATVEGKAAAHVGGYAARARKRAAP